MAQDSWYSQVSQDFKKPRFLKVATFEKKYNTEQYMETEDKENQLFVH